MKASLETAIKGICTDRTLPGLDEAGIRARVIDHILQFLGWSIFDQKEFKREYPVSGGAVDYALLVNGAPKVFIEAKRPSERLDGHQDQLLRYSGIRGVPLAILTNGFNWWLYLPLKEGDAEARQFCELDFSSQDVSATCEFLIQFLARENVYAGDAVRKAEARLKDLENAKKVDKALPQAWKELIEGPDDLLVDLINEKVKGRCGVEAGPERIKRFLVGLGKPGPKPEECPIPVPPPTTAPGGGSGTGIRGSLLGPITRWGCPRAISLANAGFRPGEVFRNNTERDHLRRRLLGPDYICPERNIKLGKPLARRGTLSGRFNDYVSNHIGEHARTAECEDVWDLARVFGTG